MRPLSRCLAASLLAAALPSQTSVTDIGLTMTSSAAGNIIGQMCGPLTCAVFPGGTIAAGSTRTLMHHANAGTPFALAIGWPGPCLPIPGIANSMLVLPMPETLTVGFVTPLSNTTAACRLGTARFNLTLPAGAPSGLLFRLQSIGVSATGEIAFGPAIEAQTL